MRRPPSCSPRSIVYFIYVDESGNTGAHVNPSEPVHWLVAVAVPVSSLQQLESEMLALAAATFGDRARAPDFEFHGSDLFSGRRECRGIPPQTRVSVYRSLAALPARHGCTVFVVGIEKERHRTRAAQWRYDAAHPHTLGFQFLLERVDRWLNRKQPRGRGPGLPHVHGLVIADEQKEVGRDVVRSFAEWRERGPSIGYAAPALRWLVDTVHHVPSTDSWPLQLADALAYLRNRYAKVMRGRTAEGDALSAADREIVSLWTTHCAPLVCSEQVWP